jgi:hypothetical protein
MCGRYTLTIDKSTIEKRPTLFRNAENGVGARDHAREPAPQS